VALALPLPLKTLSAWAAAAAARDVWEGRAPEVDPVIDESPKVLNRFDLARVFAVRVWQKATKEEEAATRLSQDYENCEERSELRLVFALDGRFYLLCRDAQDGAKARVFEVREKAGLVSSRTVAR
jgi:hypothetical protein